MGVVERSLMLGAEDDVQVPPERPVCREYTSMQEQEVLENASSNTLLG